MSNYRNKSLLIEFRASRTNFNVHHLFINICIKSCDKYCKTIIFKIRIVFRYQTHYITCHDSKSLRHEFRNNFQEETIYK